MTPKLSVSDDNFAPWAAWQVCAMTKSESGTYEQKNEVNMF